MATASIRADTAFGWVGMDMYYKYSDTTNNCSYWDANLVIYRSYSISAINVTGKMYINGSCVFAGGTSVGGGAGTTTLKALNNIEVPHNADGNKTIGFSFSQDINITYAGHYIGTVSKSGSVTAPSIPRATTPSLSCSSVKIGDAVTISTPGASSAFTHTLDYAFVTSWETLAADVKSSYVWTVPAALMSRIPSQTKSWMQIRCTTYNGSTQIGQEIVRLDVTVPDSIVPEILSIDDSDTVAGVAAAFGGYIQNESALDISVSASGVYGSAVTSCSVTVDGTAYSGQAVTTSTLRNSGSIMITASVTDSRGRMATASKTIAVTAYTPPQITAYSAYRCNADGTANDSGTYIVNAFTAHTDAIMEGRTTIQLQRLDGDTWTTLNTYTDTTVTEAPVSSGYSVDSKYQFRIAVTDYFTTNYQYQTVGPSFSLLNFNADGHGIGIGQVSTKDALQVGLPAEFNDGAVFSNLRCNTLNGDTPVLSTRTINGHRLSANIVLSASDVGAVAFECNTDSSGRNHWTKWDNGMMHLVGYNTGYQTVSNAYGPLYIYTHYQITLPVSFNLKTVFSDGSSDAVCMVGLRSPDLLYTANAYLSDAQTLDFSVISPTKVTDLWCVYYYNIWGTWR